MQLPAHRGTGGTTDPVSAPLLSPRLCLAQQRPPERCTVAVGTAGGFDGSWRGATTAPADAR